MTTNIYSKKTTGKKTKEGTCWHGYSKISLFWLQYLIISFLGCFMQVCGVVHLHLDCNLDIFQLHLKAAIKLERWVGALHHYTFMSTKLTLVAVMLPWVLLNKWSNLWDLFVSASKDFSKCNQSVIAEHREGTINQNLAAKIDVLTSIAIPEAKRRI